MLHGAGASPEADRAGKESPGGLGRNPPCLHRDFSWGPGSGSCPAGPWEIRSWCCFEPLRGGGGAP